MQEKLVKILNEMAEYLSIAQMKKLQEVLLENLDESHEEKTEISNVKEVKTAHGYVLDKEPRYVDLSYRDQDTPVITYDEKWQNARQKVKITVLKKEKDTERVLAGGVFGLYTSENIKNAKGEVLLEKDSLIEQRVTDEKGQTTFTADLPVDGKYYVKEIFAPDGFVTTDEVQEFTFEYAGEDQAEVSYDFTFENQPTTVELTKTDLTTGKELPGAHLKVTDSDGNTVDDEEAFAKELQALWNEKQTEKPKHNKSELHRFQKRYDELSKLIRGLYENLVSGLLPERQYKQLMKQYDDEQAELETKIEEMEKELTEEKVNAVDIKHFISLIRKCKEPTEISDLMFAELIDKIVVYEAEGVGKARTQKVDIYFNYVGQVDIAYTEEELAEIKAQEEQIVLNDIVYS